MTRTEIQTHLVRLLQPTCGANARYIVPNNFEQDAGNGDSGFFIDFRDLPENQQVRDFVANMGDDAIMTDKGLFFRVPA